MAVNGQCLAQPARPRGQGEVVPISPQPTHLLHPLQWLQCPDQYRRRESLPLGDHIQAVVHPIDEVDVSMPWRAIHRIVPSGTSAVGVGGPIVFSDVGFDFYDPPG